MFKAGCSFQSAVAHELISNSWPRARTCGGRTPRFKALSRMSSFPTHNGVSATRIAAQAFQSAVAHELISNDTVV